MKKLLALGLFSLSLHAADPAADLPGSQDDPTIKRYAKTYIYRFQDKSFERYILPTGKTLKSGPHSAGKFANSLTIEGRVTRRIYMSTEADRSSLELFRNYQQEIQTAGFETLFVTDASIDSRIAPSYIDDDFTHGVMGPSANTHYQSAVKKSPDGSVVYASLWAGSGSPYRPSYAPNKAPFVLLDLITIQGMDTRMTVVKADEMQRRIDAEGSIALYGIFFDFNEDTLKPESAPTLEQIATLLKAQPSLKLYVVGHTDNIGKLEPNLNLSDRRAKAVVKALVSRHGIAESRLAGAGVAFLAPIATNATEEGRAKNRRVVLVPQEKTL